MKFIGLMDIETASGAILKNSQLTSKPLSYILKMYKEGKATELGLSPYLAEATVAHVNYFLKKKEEGKVVLGGPDQAFTHGFILLEAADVKEAKKILEADPYYVQGVFRKEYSIFPWFQVI